MQNAIQHNGTIGKPISAEEWNKALQISTGHEIVSMLDSLHRSPLAISAIHLSTVREYFFSGIDIKIFPKKVAFTSLRENVVSEKNMTLCDLIRDVYANMFIAEVRPKRYEAIMDMLFKSFGCAFRKRFDQLLPGHDTMELRDILHSNLWICIYYQIGFHILGDMDAQSVMNFFVRSFLRGNFPLQGKDNFIFLVQ